MTYLELKNEFINNQTNLQLERKSKGLVGQNIEFIGSINNIYSESLQITILENRSNGDYNSISVSICYNAMNFGKQLYNYTRGQKVIAYANIKDIKISSGIDSGVNYQFELTSISIFNENTNFDTSDNSDLPYGLFKIAFSLITFFGAIIGCGQYINKAKKSNSQMEFTDFFLFAIYPIIGALIIVILYILYQIYLRIFK